MPASKKQTRTRKPKDSRGTTAEAPKQTAGTGVPARKFLSTRDALILSLPAKPAKAIDVIRQALPLAGWERDESGEWTHPERKGSTPEATASTALYVALVKAGVVLKPERGMVERGPEYAAARKAALARQKEI